MIPGGGVFEQEPGLDGGRRAGQEFARLLREIAAERIWIFDLSGDRFHCESSLFKANVFKGQAPVRVNSIRLFSFSTKNQVR